MGHYYIADNGELDLSPAQSNTSASQNETRALQLVPAAKQKASCPECGAVMLRKTLQRHLQTHKSANESPSHQCSFCPRHFARYDIRIRHEKYTHRTESRQRVECVHCSDCVSARAMKEHLQSKKCRAARNVDRNESSSISVTSETYTSRDFVQQPAIEALYDPSVVGMSLWTMVFFIRVVSGIRLYGKDASYLTNYFYLVPRQLRVELWAIRDLVLRVSRYSLDSKNKRQCSQLAYRMLVADICIFGVHSDAVKAHVAFLDEPALNKAAASGELVGERALLHGRLSRAAVDFGQERMSDLFQPLQKPWTGSLGFVKNGGQFFVDYEIPETTWSISTTEWMAQKRRDWGRG